MKLGVKNIVGLGSVREVRVHDNGSSAGLSAHQWDVQVIVETDTGWVGPISVRPPHHLFDKEIGWMSDRETARRYRDLVVMSMWGGDPVVVATQRGIEKLNAKAFGFKARVPKSYRILHRRNHHKLSPA
jgi:hypothetical protein